MKFRELFYMHKSDRQVILVLLALAAVALCAFWGIEEYGNNGNANEGSGESEKTGSEGYTSQLSDSSHQPSGSSTASPQLSSFDPNTADSAQLLRLGLSEWQVANIYKYRSRGGVYSTKEDFAQLYGLTKKQYEELAPYIHIAPEYRPASEFYQRKRPTNHYDDSSPADTVHRPHHYQEKINAGEHIDLNSLDTAEYKKVPGVGSYYARRIADYGRRLGGYVSVGQLNEISDLPDEVKPFFDVNPSPVAQLSINKLSLNELRHHPYINYYQAKAIVDYRRKHGRISDLRELHLLSEFPEEAIARLLPYISYDE